MLCPYCKEPNTQVIDSRTCEEGSAIRRRRKCPTCGEWNTMEEEIKESGTADAAHHQEKRQRSGSLQQR